MKSIFLATQRETMLATQYDSSIQAFQRSNSERDITWSQTPEEADCVVLFEEWDTRFWNYSKTLSADQFFKKFWQKILTINCDDLGRGFLPGCYTSLTPANFDRRLHRACAYPYVYNELVQREQYPEPHQRKWLFSFRGNRQGHRVRNRLFELFEDLRIARVTGVGTQFHSHSAEEKRAYIADVLDSKFVLCPRGAGPSTYRLFEVMELGRCPVIISDDWIPIEGVDWPNCAIIVKERDVAQIPDILRHHEANAEALGRSARAAWVEHFSERNKFRNMFDAVAAIHAGLQQNPTDYRARWTSWKFYRSNGWLLHQRLASRIARMAGP